MCHHIFHCLILSHRDITSLNRLIRHLKEYSIYYYIFIFHCAFLTFIVSNYISVFHAIPCVSLSLSLSLCHMIFRCVTFSLFAWLLLLNLWLDKFSLCHIMFHFIGYCLHVPFYLSLNQLITHNISYCTKLISHCSKFFFFLRHFRPERDLATSHCVSLSPYVSALSFTKSIYLSKWQVYA